MVGVVVVDLRLQLVEHLADVGLLEAQAEAFALELRTVHAASGITRFAIALAGGEFDQGVGIRRPAHSHVAVPLVPARGHGIAAAVLVVVGLGLVAGDAQVTQWSAGGRIQHPVEAAIGASGETAVDPHTQLTEALRLAVETDGASRGARPPDHGFRTFHHGEFVEGLRGDIGGRRVHPRRAGAEHGSAVGEDVQTRAEHAAQHRVTVGAAVTDGGEAGDGLEIVGAVAGGDRLARLLRIGDHGQRRTLRHGGDDTGRQLGDMRRVIFFLGQHRDGSETAEGGQRAQGAQADGSLPTAHRHAGHSMNSMISDDARSTRTRTAR